MKKIGFSHKIHHLSVGTKHEDMESHLGEDGHTDFSPYDDTEFRET